MHRLLLKPGEERRILRGHPWIFSNEVAEAPTDAQAGDLVEVRTRSGRLLGTAFYHPSALICGRLLGPGVKQVDADFFRRRLKPALELRRRIFPDDDAYRICHGESDRLPGLIVDRLGDVLVIQTLTSGMERNQEVLVGVLQDLCRPQAVVERNDAPLRRYEDLASRRGIVFGELPDDGVLIEENGIRYRVDPLRGQKTGFFLDQKLNRNAVARYCRGGRVLDLYCNLGGFALNAARAGAGQVIGVDSSKSALQGAEASRGLNGFDQVEFIQAKVEPFLESGAAEKQRFDVIILDPPALARSKKDAPKARAAYRRLNQAALGLLAPQGILATACCSFHVGEVEFYRLVQDASRRAGRRLRLLERRGQPPDHPVLPAMPESSYLKLAIFQAWDG